jgi:hypothetical protein
MTYQEKTQATCTNGFLLYSLQTWEFVYSFVSV